jgi:hypothetical protein
MSTMPRGIPAADAFQWHIRHRTCVDQGTRNPRQSWPGDPSSADVQLAMFSVFLLLLMLNYWRRVAWPTGTIVISRLSGSGGEVKRERPFSMCIPNYISRAFENRIYGTLLTVSHAIWLGLSCSATATLASASAWAARKR